MGVTTVVVCGVAAAGAAPAARVGIPTAWADAAVKRGVDVAVGYAIFLIELNSTAAAVWDELPADVDACVSSPGAAADGVPVLMLLLLLLAVDVEPVQMLLLAVLLLLQMPQELLKVLVLSLHELHFVLLRLLLLLLMSVVKNRRGLHVERSSLLGRL